MGELPGGEGAQTSREATGLVTWGRGLREPPWLCTGLFPGTATSGRGHSVSARQTELAAVTTCSALWWYWANHSNSRGNPGCGRQVPSSDSSAWGPSAQQEGEMLRFHPQRRESPAFLFREPLTSSSFKGWCLKTCRPLAL